MPEQELNRAEVGARLEEMDRERLAPRMRRDRFGNARPSARLLPIVNCDFPIDRSESIEVPFLCPRMKFSIFCLSPEIFPVISVVHQNHPLFHFYR